MVIFISGNFSTARHSIRAQTCMKSKLLHLFSQCSYLPIILTLKRDIAMADMLLWPQGCNLPLKACLYYYTNGFSVSSSGSLCWAIAHNSLAISVKVREVYHLEMGDICARIYELLRRSATPIRSLDRERGARLSEHVTCGIQGSPRC